MLEYYQIAKDGQSEIEIKGSRFICHLKRVDTVEAANNFIASIKKEHKKATHNCSAYLIGEQDNIQKAHDDGEPSGTAGVPMLEVLKKNQLHFIACVVTRYFGGTKLGAGGLIRAYSSSVSHALNEIGIILHAKQKILMVDVDYTLSGKFEYFLKNSTYILQNTTYTNTITYQIGVLAKEFETFTTELVDNFKNKLVAVEIDEIYIDLPVQQNKIDLQTLEDIS